VRALALVLLLATPAAAEEPEELPIYLRPAYQQAFQAASRWRTGHPAWYAGFGLVGTSISSNDVAVDAGGGASAWLGLHLIPQFALEIGWTASVHGSQMATRVFQGVTTDARAYFLRSARLDAYVQAGFGIYALGPDYGAGMQAGFGVDYWVGSAITLGTRVVYRVTDIAPSDVVNPTGSMTVVMLEAGTALHF
jgi:hypothetical protein